MLLNFRTAFFSNTAHPFWLPSLFNYKYKICRFCYFFVFGCCCFLSCLRKTISSGVFTLVFFCIHGFFNNIFFNFNLFMKPVPCCGNSWFLVLDWLFQETRPQQIYLDWEPPIYISPIVPCYESPSTIRLISLESLIYSCLFLVLGLVFFWPGFTPPVTFNAITLMGYTVASGAMLLEAFILYYTGAVVRHMTSGLYLVPGH